MKPIGLVPELYCADIKKSLEFYIDILGFSIAYQRPEDGFAYIRKGNAELMLEQIMPDSSWISGELAYPFGRGINFQIETDEIDSLYSAAAEVHAKIFLPIEEKWYRADNILVGHRQFIVQDPDGYLLRFFKDLGTRLV